MNHPALTTEEPFRAELLRAAGRKNGLKLAFDWKSRWNQAHGIDPALSARHVHGVPARPRRAWSMENCG